MNTARRSPLLLRIVFAPAAAWQAIRADDPACSRSLLGYAMPLALLPALAWPIGQAAAGHLPAEPSVLLGAFAATFLLSLANVALLALTLVGTARFYGLPAAPRRAAALAAYGSTPVLLAGVLLVVPVLIVASMAALLHCFVLLYMGAPALLGVRERDAAAFVAIACTAAAFLAFLLGALVGAAGL